MAFVHEHSCGCTKSELDLFSVPPMQTSMESGNWIEYHPLTSVADGGPIEFEINGTSEDYIDFTNSCLHVQAKITNLDGTALAQGTSTGPVNLWLHSLFMEVDVQLNETLITSSTNTYPYRTMLETLLSYGHDAKRSHLTSALFYKDEAGKMDSFDQHADHQADLNGGLRSRSLHMCQSRVVDMLGRLHCDIFMQDRLMQNEVNVKINLQHAKHAFCIMSGADATMVMRKMKLSPSVFVAHTKALENGTAKYPIRHVVCKTITMGGGFQDLSHEKLFSGQLPTRVVIGLVTHQAFNGHREHNPFNFRHFGVTEVSVYLGGQQQSGIKPMELNFADSLYARAYHTLFGGTGKANRDEGNYIDREDYRQAYALYAFDLTADLGDEEHFNRARLHGIDRNRNVIFDFGA